MKMGEAWRIGNDGIGDKWACGCRAGFNRSTGHPLFHGPVRCLCSSAVAGLIARPPKSRHHTANLFAPSPNVSTPQRIEAGHQAGVLDHESHELGRIPTDIEEFEAVVLDKISEDGMGSKAHSMMVLLPEHLSKRNKGLCIAAGADDVYDDIERWWATA